MLRHFVPAFASCKIISRSFYNSQWIALTVDFGQAGRALRWHIIWMMLGMMQTQNQCKRAAFSLSQSFVRVLMQPSTMTHTNQEATSLFFSFKKSTPGYAITRSYS